jgi:hypothetical protein
MKGVLVSESSASCVSPERLKPAEGVTVDVSPLGWLELAKPEAGVRVLCDESKTAMWIALRQYGGDVGEAAQKLADICAADPFEVRDVMVQWFAELRASGYLTTTGAHSS